MNKYRIWAIILIILAAMLGWFIYASEVHTSGFFSRYPFKLGLDLAGGTQLVYKADTTQVASADVDDALESLKEVIERRVNAFGVGEPIIQIEGAGAFSKDNKLIVELPGITDVNEAIEQIGKTPALEFKLLTSAEEVSTSTLDAMFAPTGLTGRLLSRATVEFNPQVPSQALVSLQFNDEGAELFAKITRENTGKILAIFLDGEIKSTPVIQEEILGGKAQISGNFKADEARQLVRDLNLGALPVPIELISTQTVGPSLGATAVQAGVTAGIWGSILVIIFLILWYRLPGVVASVALALYVLISLAAFKLIPVTLTAAGIAGFILSIGMAVDANILIFERMKEELQKGKKLDEAMHEGFHRAWLSIRDSNVSSIITAIVLFWLGTSAVKGFALTLGLGVFVSMFTAITASRTFLFALSREKESKISKFLFGAGFTRSKNLEPKA